MLIIDPDSSPDTSPRPSPLSEPAYLPPIPSALDMATHKDRKDSDDGFEMLDVFKSTQPQKDQACITDVKHEQTTDQSKDQVSPLGKVIVEHEIKNKDDEKDQNTEGPITETTMTPTGPAKGSKVNDESKNVTIRTLGRDQIQSQLVLDNDAQFDDLEPKETTDDVYLPPVSSDESKSTAALLRPKTDGTVNKLSDSQAVSSNDDQAAELAKQESLIPPIGETNKDDQNPEAPKGFRTPHQVPASEVSEGVIERDVQIKSEVLDKPFQSDNQGSHILISVIETPFATPPSIISSDEPTDLLTPTPATVASTPSANSFKMLSGTPTSSFQAIIAPTKSATLSEADGVILGLIPQSRQAEYSTGHQIGAVGLSTAIRTPSPQPTQPSSEFAAPGLTHQSTVAEPAIPGWDQQSLLSTNDSDIDLASISGLSDRSDSSQRTEKAVSAVTLVDGGSNEQAGAKTSLDEGEGKVKGEEEPEHVWLAERLKQYKTLGQTPTSKERSTDKLQETAQAFAEPNAPNTAIATEKRTTNPNVRSQTDIDRMSKSQRKKYKAGLALALIEETKANATCEAALSPSSPLSEPGASESPATDDPTVVTKVDLASQMKDTFRLLHLYQEQGTSGLNEKILIDQEDVVRLANTCQPGAALDIDRIDFAKLDDSILHIRGVYGDRERLVKYLVDLGAVDESLSQALLNSDETNPNRASMRCGLYLVKLPSDQAVIFFWPEQMTWNREATKNVVSNRVTFMRYLSKVSDQLYCLIDKKQLKDLDFKIPDADHDDSDTSDDEMDAVADLSVQRVSEAQEGIRLDNERSKLMHIGLPSLSSSLPTHVTADLRPRLVTGLKNLGLMTARYCEAKTKVYQHTDKSMAYYALQSLIATSEITIGPQMPMNEIDLLIRSDLLQGVKSPQAQWSKLRSESDARVNETHKSTLHRLATAADANSPNYKAAAEVFAVGSLAERFPSFAVDIAIRPVMVEKKRISKLSNKNSEVESQAIQALDVCADAQAYLRKDFTESRYQRGKTYILEVLHILNKHPDMSKSERNDLSLQLTIDINADDEEFGVSAVQPGKVKSAWQTLKGVFGLDTDGQLGKLAQEYQDDASFIRRLSELGATHPCLQRPAEALMIIARESLLLRRDDMIREGGLHLHREAVEAAKQEAAAKGAYLQRVEDGKITQAYIAWLNSEIRRGQGDSYPRSIVVLQNVQEIFSVYSGTKFSVTFKETKASPALVQYEVRLLGVNSTQLNLMVEEAVEAPHNPQLDVICANSLKVYLAPHLSIRSFVYLDDRQSTYIMVVDDPKSAKLCIYLSTDHKATLQFDKADLESDYLVAVDVKRRVFAIVSSHNRTIYNYKIAPDSLSCKAQLEIDMKNRCAPDTRFFSATFLADTTKQELVLVDSTGQARIFSMASLQFRPPSVALPNFDPRHLLSTVDGSAFLSTYKDGEEVRLRGHMSTSFGQQDALDGHALDIVLSPSTDIAVFAPASSGRMVLVYLDPEAQTIRSTRLIISNEDAQDQLLPNRRTRSAPTSAGSTQSPLLGVFDDMWTRFPVVAAIERDNLDASTRVKPALTLVEPTSGAIKVSQFQAHWNMVVADFKKRTNKPTNGTIETTVLGVSTDIVLTDHVSSFKLGQLLVELCCLIPLHVAVARDQAFIPFTRGVDDIEWARSLLGETVEAIAASISLGWYEAILGQYYRHKPLRVISSLGNQSVGKSYMLNHIAGSSFAGAAGRTTEGVWMAVAPTKECIYVLLDFEGVNSPERSLQEDMFLVLFNAALSNMVLFRNHLDVGRDLLKLFEAYKSSATYFDPDANPGLFNGKLVMIIKDVLRNDGPGACTEFKQKFQEMIAADGDKNFLTRLHRKQMKIVPWPVIQDPRFYSHFDRHIVKDLQSMEPTWKTAGQFVDTLKLLEAKLKATDWTPLDSGLVSQRIKLLKYVLPVAIAKGTSDEDRLEPLTEIASAYPIIIVGQHHFDCITFNDKSPTASFDNMYQQYLRLHPRSTSDHEWKSGFLADISTALEWRITLVTQWAETNIQSLSQDHSDVIQWRADVKHAVDRLRQSYRTCSQSCNECEIPCLLLSAHDGEHDCRTDHKCDQKCGYDDEHKRASPPCNLRAMHQSRHVCNPKVHTCSVPCAMEKSCKSTCTSTRDHPAENGHICSAKIHICDLKCDFDNGEGHKCGGRCTLKLDEPHPRHECINRSCSMVCALCPRMCSQNDHFHGMETGAIHLCGQDHACKQDCEHKGICEIAPHPSSVQTMFQGTRSTYQYTKFTQLAKRLKCVKKIPAGKLNHHGDHSHHVGKKRHHFCDQKCPSCQYYCRLPFGHPQSEHDTSHGSMTATRWSIEDGEEIRVGAHTFAQGDEGAPMLCDKVCSGQGRHTHIVECHSHDVNTCGQDEEDLEHIHKRISPHPDRPKDAITHKLHFQQMGWKDPYTRQQQDEFKLCDHVCAGVEHHAGKASHCIRPMFHAEDYQGNIPQDGYMGDHGHVYECKYPWSSGRASHIIFVLDRSGTMASHDRKPKRDGPGYSTIAPRANNRYGSMLSACHRFWTSRQITIDSLGPNAGRGDTYSIIHFNEQPLLLVENDVDLKPNDLFAKCLQYSAAGGADVASALERAQEVMLANWDDDNIPVVIFLSDGDFAFSEEELYPICRMASAKRIPLNLHAVSFGPNETSYSLRRMVDTSQHFYHASPKDSRNDPGNGCSFSTSLDTVQIDTVFSGSAETLQKPRGSLVVV